MRPAIFKKPPSFEKTDREVKPEHILRDFHEGDDAIVAQHRLDVRQRYLEISGRVNAIRGDDDVVSAPVLLLRRLLHIQHFEPHALNALEPLPRGRDQRG